MIPRRAFLGLGAAGLVGCAQSRGEYFGSTAPPSSRKLVYSLLGEVESLDPAKSTGGLEFYVIPALFEGLTVYHPHLPQPMAALATHYEVSRQYDQFTFYLRGHSSPRGIRLPNADSLSADFTGGQSAAPDASAAYWSDGRKITAHDFVYSWRRFLDPATAAPLAYQLYYIENGEEVASGKRSSHALGVRALDDFTFQVDLRSPTPFFLQSITSYPFNAVPRQAIEAARQRGTESSWTEPQHIVVSGPFTLRKWIRYEIMTAVKNPRYFEANIVSIDELTFLPIVNGSTTVNLYRAGAVTAMPGVSFPPLFTPVVGGKKDFHTEPAFATISPAVSALKPPLDNVLLRYALNMATEKKAFTGVLGAGQTPARGMVPPMAGYNSPDRLPVEIDGHTYDVLSFDVKGARALLDKAGYSARGKILEINYHLPVLPETKLKAEIFQQQCRSNLGVRVNLAVRELSVHFKMIFDGDYNGVADFAFLPTYFDPNPFLDPFLTTASGNPSGWTNPGYASMLKDANRTLNPPERMAKLAKCEERLLLGMPCLPLYFDVWAYLQKPFVQGLTSNLFDIRAFKYARIDTNWQPQ